MPTILRTKDAGCSARTNCLNSAARLEAACVTVQRGVSTCIHQDCQTYMEVSSRLVAQLILRILE